jgi:hypothetical protein
MSLWSKEQRVRRAENLTTIYEYSRLSRQCGILNISQLCRPPRPVTGIALLYFYKRNLYLADKYCTILAGAVAVKALCYKPEGRGFDTR